MQIETIFNVIRCLLTHKNGKKLVAEDEKDKKTNWEIIDFLIKEILHDDIP